MQVPWFFTAATGFVKICLHFQGSKLKDKHCLWFCVSQTAVISLHSEGLSRRETRGFGLGASPTTASPLASCRCGLSATSKCLKEKRVQKEKEKERPAKSRLISAAQKKNKIKEEEEKHLRLPEAALANCSGASTQ